jgi:heme exporter protein A
VKLTLTVENVSKAFGRTKPLRGVGFTVHEGERVGIAGSNGSGKSTLVKVISTLLTPDAGKVTLELDGKVIDPDNMHAHIGLVAPYVALYDEFSPRELLEVTARLRGMPWSDGDTMQLLELLELSHVMDRTARGFSSGMTQRLRLAVALQHAPALLLFDEPSMNLDEKGVEVVRRLVFGQEPHGAILIASNDKRELNWCTRTVNVETWT